MKKIYFLLLGLVIVLASCKDNTNVVVPPTKTDLLVRTWVPGTVSVTENGEVGNVTKYSSFSLRFSKTSDMEGGYFVTSGNEAFPDESGKWKFGNENKTTIIFDYDIEDKKFEVAIATLEAAKFRFTYTRKGYLTGGKTSVIPTRNFVFDLVSF